jgi:ABC-type transport system substrate-binding protein
MGLLAGAMALLGVAGLPAPAQAAEAAAKPKVLQLPMRTDGPKSLDPAAGSTQYDNIAVAQIFETLLTFNYAKPGELEPLLLEKMPDVADNPDGTRTITFMLKEGVRFHDSPAFRDGKGRVLTSDDVFYSIKRLADKKNQLKNWWLLEGVIKGLDEYKDAQNKAADAGGKFDYDAPVSGFVKKSDREFEIILNKPVHRFLYTLTQFQTSIVPREAVEHFGDRFMFNPVGTGPFVLEKWEPKQYLYLNRNPAYHDVKYPARDQWSAADRRLRLDRPAGQKVPFVDRMEFRMFVQDQPMWLEFDTGKLGYIEVPNEYFEQAFDKRTKQLLPKWAERGVRGHSDQLLDFIFSGFNMADPLLGAMTAEGRALRQAIHLAVDLDEINEAYYNGLNTVFDGMIPPNVEGHPEGGKGPISFRGPDLDRAKKLLAQAGWPNGRNAKGEQLVIEYYTANNAVNVQQAEMMKRQIERLGVKFEVRPNDFSTLIQFVNEKKAPMFGFAWGSDYPDGENNLALFYGPNESPGSNHYNYKNPAYDKLYEQILKMAPSPERTKLYEQMRDMVISDTPYIGSMGRTRFYLMAPWIMNCRPTERMFTWYKYLDVDDSKR